MKREKPAVAIQSIAASFHEAAAVKRFEKPIRTVECLTFHACRKAELRFQP